MGGFVPASGVTGHAALGLVGEHSAAEKGDSGEPLEWTEERMPV